MFRCPRVVLLLVSVAHCDGEALVLPLDLIRLA